MRFFAQAREVFDGSQPAGEPKDHIDGDQTAELQPGKRRAINTKPQRLTNYDICFGRFFTRKPAVEKVDDRKKSTRERHESKNKKSPALPDKGKGLCDEKI